MKTMERRNKIIDDLEEAGISNDNKPIYFTGESEYYDMLWIRNNILKKPESLIYVFFSEEHMNKFIEYWFVNTSLFLSRVRYTDELIRGFLIENDILEKFIMFTNLNNSKFFNPEKSTEEIKSELVKNFKFNADGNMDSEVEDFLIMNKMVKLFKQYMFDNNTEQIISRGLPSFSELDVESEFIYYKNITGRPLI